MNKTKTVKRIGLIVDILMYTLMVVQMGYVFTGNVVHAYDRGCSI